MQRSSSERTESRLRKEPQSKKSFTEKRVIYFNNTNVKQHRITLFLLYSAITEIDLK